MKNIIVTGGAGFIGSNFLNEMVIKYPDYNFINLDWLTYAGDMRNLSEINKAPNYNFCLVDIREIDEIRKVFSSFGNIDGIIHFAAESHVDNSINNPAIFIETNINGTFNLLQVAYENWKDDLENHTFYHISTDEVYGSLSLDTDELFAETTPYAPHSPYSASKASSDFLVKAFHDTYGMKTLISHCSNNYGPRQHKEKLIPKIINNVIEGINIPVYGDGKNVRDWLYVLDHVYAIDTIYHNGKPGEVYNIGGNNEISNIDLVYKIIDLVDEKLNRFPGYSHNLIEFVEDRKGHDLRYGIDSSKLKNELGWTPSIIDINDGLRKTVDWYVNEILMMVKLLNKKFE